MNAGTLSPENALKEAVSSLDAAARDWIRALLHQVPLTARRKRDLERLLFHSIDAFREFETVFDINPLDGITEAQRKALRKMYARRHIFEHDSGTVDRRYLEESGDTTVAVGDLIRETRENIHNLIGMLNKMTGNIARGFEELVPAVDDPIQHERDRRERMRRP